MKIYQVVKINEHQGFIEEYQHYFGIYKYLAEREYQEQVWYAKKNSRFNDTIELRVYESEKPLSELTEEDIIKMMCYGYTTEDSYTK